MNEPTRARLRVDGEAVAVDPSSWTLVRYLRERLDKTAAKVGCAEGSCGACTVLVDAVPTRACVVPLGLLDGAQVDTLAALAETDDGRRVVEVFTQLAPMQCGFCTPGIVVTAIDLRRRLTRTPHRSEVIAALDGHLCRCTGYQPYVDAVLRPWDATPGIAPAGADPTTDR